MRSFRRFTSGESQAAAARFPDFLLAMASPLKKSLRAAERKRADVARARRRWIREQGFLDQAHLVYRRDGSHHHLLTAGSFACAREGADVLIAYLNEDQDAKETQRLVEEVGRKTVLVAGDISAPEHCRAIIDRC